MVGNSSANEIKFIVDHNVGKLARWLRMMGFDSLFFSGGDDSNMVKQALAEGRIILTRDTEIMKRRVINNGRLNAVLIESEEPERQIQQLMADSGPEGPVPPIHNLPGMQSAPGRKKPGRSKGKGAPLRLQNADPVHGVPCLPPHLLAGHPLESDDAQAGKTGQHE